MTVTMARVAISAIPGGEPIEYAVEVEPDRIAARYRSVVDPDEFFTVVEAAIVGGCLEGVVWHDEWTLVVPEGLQAQLLARMRRLAWEYAPDS